MVSDQKTKKKATRRHILAATTAALAAAALVLGCAANGAAGGPQAKKGFIVYERGAGPILLVGEWERREGGADAAPGLAPASLRVLPYEPAREAAGTVAYRVRVGLAGEDRQGIRRMALYAPSIASFEAAYIDGRVVYDRSADPSPSPIMQVAAEGPAVEIELRSGPGGPRLESPGLIPPILAFGESLEVERFQAEALGAVFAFLSGFLLLGFIALLFFAFWRKNRESLGFAAYILASGALYALAFAADFPLAPLAARIGASAQVRAAALDLQACALAFFLWTLYREQVAPWLRILALAAPVALAAATLALPTYYERLALASVAYRGLFALAALALLAAMAIQKDERARWLLPAFLASTAALVASYLLPPTLAVAAYLAPAGDLAFGFACAVLLVKKVGDNFGAVEALSDYVASVSRTVRNFIPKEFLEHLKKEDVTDLRLGDHAKEEMTIFFSDIRAFTELSERLTVEENFAFINSYLARVVPIIRENGGFVDKYVGDGIMALFPEKQGPDQAIRSAIAMQGKMLEYNGHRAKVGYRPISMGVGIHTGDLMLGVVGVSDRMENTVISDAVNLASRLQAITKAFNIAIAISEQAFKELEDPGAYKYRFIGKVKVKGKAAPVSVFEIFDGIAPELFERKMKANMFFEQGMLAYYQKDFAGSIYYFKRVLDIIPEDGASGFYLENCMNKAGSALSL